MHVQWLKIIVASFFEVGWVIGLKHAYDFWTWFGTVIAIVVSFYFLIMAGRILPVGTVYAVFVGLGTMGTVLVEILMFSESFLWGKLVLIALLLVGVVGLKLVTPTKREEQMGAEQ